MADTVRELLKQYDAANGPLIRTSQIIVGVFGGMMLFSVVASAVVLLFRFILHS
jgi:hypothetical protein